MPPQTGSVPVVGAAACGAAACGAAGGGAAGAAACWAPTGAARPLNRTRTNTLSRRMLRLRGATIESVVIQNDMAGQMACAGSLPTRGGMPWERQAMILLDFRRLCAAFGRLARPAGVL